MKKLLFLLCLFYQIGFTQIDTILLCEAGTFANLQAIEGQFAYQWLPNSSISNPTIYNPIAFPNETTTYIAKMIPALIGENLISNPDFSEGNVDFVSDYPFVERINTQGVYGVNTSASNLNGVFFTDCPDHTSGEGLMMVVDGSPVANEKVWCQTIEVKPSTSYAFSAWLTSVKKENPAQLQFSINGSRIGNIFEASSQVCEWRQFFEVWAAEEATAAEICIVNRNTNPSGNDFALDDFAFYEIEDIIYDTTVVLIENLVVDTIKVVQIPDCGEENGQVQIESSGGFGNISYAINGSSFQTNSVIEKLSAGEYRIAIKDDFAATSCIVEGLLTVNQKNCPIYIPNIFSPNDDGRNEYFVLKAHPDFRGRIARLSIFDRWGNQVFHVRDVEVSEVLWDGRMKGENMEEGLYVYALVVAYDDGSEVQMEGEVNVIR